MKIEFFERLSKIQEVQSLILEFNEIEITNGDQIDLFSRQYLVCGAYTLAGENCIFVPKYCPDIDNFDSLKEKIREIFKDYVYED